MEFDEPGWPMIDDFFSELGVGRTAATCRRYTRVRLRLYDFLDVDDMSAWLTPDDTTLLAAEREFRREGAVRSVLGVEGLVRCLPGFVADERLPETGAEARMQVSVTDRLLDHLRRFRHVDASMAHSFGEAKRAVRRGRLAIEMRRSPSLAAAIHEIDARFRQQPGPQW